MNCSSCQKNNGNPCYRCPCLSVCNSIRIDEIELEIEKLRANSSILYGELPPESDIGNNGDIYLCCSLASLWKKINDTWILQEVILCNFNGGEF